MKNLRYQWKSTEGEHSLELVWIRGTDGEPFRLGEGTERRFINVRSFFIGTVPVTQALWMHVAGSERAPAGRRGMNLPMENVSWNVISGPRGFLERINSSPILSSITQQISGPGKFAFRLPSEAEWEYAARGGENWTDGFRFSGSNDIDHVAWFKDNSADQTHEVAQKAPNQLGLFDMSGNIWEWCRDCYHRDVERIPVDGTPLVGDNPERVLRGGCFHNWAIHCTVSKRYEIGRQFHDGCIGFRLVLSAVQDTNA